MADPITRRRFLTIMGTTGTGLLVGISLAGCDETEQPTTSASTSTFIPRTPRSEDTSLDLPVGMLAPTIFLAIDPSGATTITSFRSEMGQGIRTAIAMILAEELDADWGSLVVEQAPADPAFGDQVTGGSQSISTSYRRLRRAGATTRWLLVEAAARLWDVPHEACTTEPGVVVHPDGERRLAYGDLAGKASELEVPRPEDVPLKDESTFRIIGTNVHHIDGPDIVTGAAVYGFDVRVPDMVYAAVARRPTFDGSLRGFDDAAARAVGGVIDVFALDTAVVTVASSTWAALEGRRALTVEWDAGDSADLTTEMIWADVDRRLTEAPADGEITATYRIPYQAHMSMEPMNSVADVRQDSCEVWAPTQDPQRVRRSAASRLGLPEESVVVHVPLMGGGFGRRLSDDYAIEAVRISERVGRPVQVVWTREDDTRHDFYHPLSLQFVRATPAIDAQPRVRSLEPIDYVPTGAWRSVGDHPTAFAMESFLDEMAHALGMDPLEFRRARHGGRAPAVIELAAERAGWGDPLPAGWGRGIAHHALFGVTDVAMVALVEVAGGRVRVHRMTAAVDCGQVVNPTTVVAQVEGAIAFGLTAALKGGVTVERGRIVEGNFHDAPILSLNEMPEVDVHVAPSTGAPSGVGEAGVPPVAPAVANAVFAAIGERVRTLPIDVSSG